MLAYNTKNELKEYVEAEDVTVCNNCHRLYRQVLVKQTTGMRERDYDYCPYCGSENESSMSYEYCNSKIDNKTLKKLKKKSLMSTIVKYCHKEYVNGSCTNCNHEKGCPGKCDGNCKNCLTEVHFPNKYPFGKKDYDCQRMLQFYVCDYTFKYVSEMLYLMRESEALKHIDTYHVVSIGCGGCPDLMAFEKYCHQEQNWKSVSYLGVDVNENWKSIHEVIKAYKTTTLIKTRFKYVDAVDEEFDKISEANVIVLQYVISHFYNTNQIQRINLFFDKLVDKIMAHRQKGIPFVVLINDVNSNKRGRDYFMTIIKKLRNAGFHGNGKRFYFDYNIQNEFQQYGNQHKSNDILFKIPTGFDIYEPWEKCSSAQLLIEVWKEDK